MLPAAAPGEQRATAAGCGAGRHQVPVLPCRRASGLPESHQAANLSTAWFECTWCTWCAWCTWRTWGQMSPPWKLHLLPGFVGSRLPPSSDKARCEHRGGQAVNNGPTGQSWRVENSWLGGSTLSDEWLCFLRKSRYEPALLKVLLTPLQASPSLQGIAAFLHQG